MIRLVMLRHGESTWNLENRFTGWTDVDLTEQGIREAHQAGQAPEREGLHLRSGPHVGPEKGDPDPLDRPRRDGPDVDSRLPLLAAQ